MFQVLNTVLELEDQLDLRKPLVALHGDNVELESQTMLCELHILCVCVCVCVCHWVCSVCVCGCLLTSL